VQPGSNDMVVRITGPLPIPDTAGLRTALDSAGLAGTSIEVELVPGEVVKLKGS